MKPTVVILVACAVVATACSAKDRSSDLDGGAAGEAGAAQDAGSGGAAGSPQDAGTDTWCESLNDNNVCTSDECDPITGGVKHIALPAIDDSNACTVDACNPATAEITHTPMPIDDGKACTLDACDHVTAEITHTPQEKIQCTPCPDGWIEDIDSPSAQCPNGWTYVCTC